MRILVTGGAGFIGSHLCDRLIELGHHVIALDNLHTGSIENISHLLTNANFQFIEGDVADPINIDVEGVFNLACPASPVHYQSDPIRTMKTNVLGTLSVLTLASRLNIRMVQASTSEVYGDPLEIPQRETYWGNVNPVGLRSCYDEGKRAAETLVSDFKRIHGVDGRIARIFNTYGPRMAVDDGRVISNFIVQAIQNQPLSIYGDGKQTRSFCYISDLVEGLVRMFFSKSLEGPVNLGNTREISLIQLVREIEQIMAKSLTITNLPLPKDDPRRRVPDISTARLLLDWYPKVSLNDGLKLTTDFFQKKLEND